MTQLRRSTRIGFFWTILIGTLLHFTYQWSGENRVVGLYSAVNESAWEHLKLLFFPVLAYTVFEYLWIGHRWRGYVLARVQGALLGMLTTLASFYTYTGILGQNWLAADILTFLAGAAVAACFTQHRILKEHGDNRLGVLLFALIAVCFGIFSLCPPSFGMFLSP